jgi:hypothetical protein
MEGDRMESKETGWRVKRQDGKKRQDGERRDSMETHRR